MTEYGILNEKLKALISDVPHLTANLANTSALIFNSLEDVSWVGFYLLERDKLVLNAFQGKPACIEIAVGRGVCGSAVSDGEIKLVPDVHEFPGHIACDPESNSEIVIPVCIRGKIFGVLDIDSKKPGRFDKNDSDGLSLLIRTLESIISQII